MHSILTIYDAVFITTVKELITIIEYGIKSGLNANSSRENVSFCSPKNTRTFIKIGKTQLTKQYAMMDMVAM